MNEMLKIAIRKSLKELAALDDVQFFKLLEDSENCDVSNIIMSMNMLEANELEVRSFDFGVVPGEVVMQIATYTLSDYIFNDDNSLTELINHLPALHLEENVEEKAKLLDLTLNLEQKESNREFALFDCSDSFLAA
ncbi:hypothetical protein EHQ46_05780 [Leptospira yanagawae]|uniref:Uncharacterized protein n=1 Tax=Leptospira yanagawae TaxID=293069 RepID=A0ABY2M588_9LEPT|nr:hypothetical protein [Leptospira yanagawae]TGL23146.1 hypothetical protein EHQ46_05780 [Leptospira yanagawae]